MTPDELKEHQFEADIEQYLLTEGGYTKGTQATYDKEKAIDLDTLIRFIKDSQPKAWEKFERVFGANAKAELYKTMQGDILKYGLIHTLRKGIKNRGIEIQLCYFAFAITHTIRYRPLFYYPTQQRYKMFLIGLYTYNLFRPLK